MSDNVSLLDRVNALDKANITEKVNVQINGTTHTVEKGTTNFRLSSITGYPASTYLLFRSSWTSPKL